MNLRTKVLDEINAERNRQEAKWGQQNHRPERWLSILGEEFGEVCKAVCEASFPGYQSSGDWSQYRKELIHVAAVAAAMAECFDRREVNWKTYPAGVTITKFDTPMQPNSGDTLRVTVQRDETGAYNKKVLEEAEEINRKYADKKQEQTLTDVASELTKIAAEALKTINTLVKPFE